MTPPEEDLETRLTRVLTAGAENLPVGEVVPPFGTFGAGTRRHKRRRISRKVTVVAAVVGLALTGTAAAAVVTYLTSAPVTETDLARCYSVDSLAGGENFAGLSVTASGPIGSHARVTNALAACTPSWADGFLILGSTEVGGSRLPSGNLTPDHPVPPLVVCVLHSGIAAVFPGNPTTCRTLGLPAALGYQPAQVRENAP